MIKRKLQRIYFLPKGAAFSSKSICRLLYQDTYLNTKTRAGVSSSETPALDILSRPKVVL